MNNLRSFKNHHPVIAHSAYIDPNATVIGQVEIGEYSSVWPNVVIRGDVNTISIGTHTNVQDGSVLHCTHDGPFTPGGQPLIIGNYNTIGHMVMLHGATIENNCLIGMNSILLDGCIIESQTISADGSLVPQGKRLTSGYLWMGQPAKQIRKLTDEELSNLTYSAEHYVRLSKGYKLD
jgi:carbonic anhydrase/acetyltransferase-like protein (isoleucine patch superfamily)